MSDTQDLASLEASDFSPHLETAFRLPMADGDQLELTLIDVSGRGGDTVADAKRQPFSAVFRGPEDRVFEQQMCTLEHHTLGTLELFLVPLGPDEEGMRYEAVFS